MHSFNIREVRAHLTKIIAQVCAGQAVAITPRGREVARIAPTAQAPQALPRRAEARTAMVKRGAKTTQSTVATMRSEECC